MEAEIDECIRKRIQWANLPGTVKKLLGDSPKEYERYIFEFSIKNQLRFKGSLVRTVRKDEKKYYEALVQNSIQRLMLYPYHLADMIVKGLRITPFIYYIEVVALLIELEKSYDTLPNFTAADCLRLLGIGRNEYLELIARARSLGRRGRSKAIRGLLPRVPLNIPMQPWWRVELGYVLEEDVKPLCESEKALIDLLIDQGSQTAGTLDYNTVKTLYRRGLIYLDVPITSADRACVPPLKGFVMNRTAGDYFETLLYQVFVSIDEHTTVGELATVLQVDIELVKQVVSLYCRLGFARVLAPPLPPPHAHHPSWRDALTTHSHQPYRQIAPLTFDSGVEEVLQMEPVLIKDEPCSSHQVGGTCSSHQVETSSSHQAETSGRPAGDQRVAVLFDSTLAAYLMMGNLSPDLKSHAVTLFEVGKLCDESLDSLLMELDKVAGSGEIEGEARRYLAAAACLRATLRALRPLRPLDLLRCEALHALGAARDRLLASKYRLAISFAPLGREARAGIAARALPHAGPAPPESATPWMRLYLYHRAGYGPPSLLLTKGTVLRCVPRALLGFARLCVWWWGAEGEWSPLPAAAALAAANAALRRGPVLLQAAAVRTAQPLRHIAFPPAGNGGEWRRHAGLARLLRRLRLRRAAGYVTLVDIGVPDLGAANPPPSVQLVAPRKKKDVCGVAKPVSEMSISSSESGENNDRLQSPIESHFAVTPTIDNGSPTRDNNSPAIDNNSPTRDNNSPSIDNSPTRDNNSPPIDKSPANGFTSVESNQLLCEELDSLNIEHRSKESVASEDFVAISSPESKLSNSANSKESIADELEKIISQQDQFTDLLSPADESVSVFSRLAASGEGDSGVDTAHNDDDDEACKPERWTILELHWGIPLFDEELCAQVCASVVDDVARPHLLEKLKEDNEFLRADLLKFVSQCQYYPGEDMGIVKRGTLVPLPRRNLVFENGRISEWNGK